MTVSIFECAPDRKARARGVLGFALALALPVLAAPIAVGSPAWFLLMAPPLVLLAWAAIDWRAARRAWVALDTGRVWTDGTDRAWTRDTVVAVRTGSAAGAEPAAAAGGLLPVQHFDLELWTKAKAGASAPSALSQQIAAAPRGERGHEARARMRQQLGAPDQRLVTSQSPVPVLNAARAVASALRVPWFHEGTLGLDVRTAEHVTLALADREPLRPWPFPEHLSDPSRTRVRQSSSLDGARFEWDYSRLPAIFVLLLTAVALLGLTIVDLVRGATYALVAWVLLDAAAVYALYRVIGEHDTYAIEVQPTEFLVSGRRTLHIARDDLHDIEVRLTQRPAVFLIGRGVARMLPTETPFSAYWLAHAISRAAREIQAAPIAGK